MADMPNLPFITKNPALEEFRTQRKSDTEDETLRQVLDERTAAAPSRLRKVSSEADLEGTRAAGAAAELPYVGSNAQIANQSNREQLDERTAGAPSRLRNLNAGAGLAETHAQTAAAEAPYAGPKAAVGLRQATATAKHAEMEPQYKAIELAAKGDVAGAKQIAAAAGVNIPDEFWNDRELTNAISHGVKYVETAFPNRPRDKDTWMKKYREYLTGLRQGGQSISDPGLPYHFDKGPQPQEIGGTGANRFQAFPGEGTDEEGKPVKGLTVFNRQDSTSEFRPGATITSRAGSSAGRPPADVAMAEWLIKNGVVNSPEEAWNTVRRARSNPDMERQKFYSNALRATYGNAAKAKQITEEFFGGPAPTGRQPPPARAPAAAPQRPDLMTPGDGGRPLDIQIPPAPFGVPPGSSYSPSRQMWRSPDGRVFDMNGRPVQ